MQGAHYFYFVARHPLIREKGKPLEMTRRELLACAASGLALVGAGALGIDVARADTVDRESVNARFNRIFDAYEVGDILSPEDAAFVAAHASPAGNGQDRSMQVVDASRYYNGHTYQLNGNKYHYTSGDSALWHDYGATLNAGSPTVVSSEIQVGIRFLAYGLTGGSYELIHKDEQSYAGWNTNWYGSEFHGTYMGLLDMTSFSCYARITTSSNQSFLVQ